MISKSEGGASKTKAKKAVIETPARRETVKPWFVSKARIAKPSSTNPSLCVMLESAPLRAGNKKPALRRVQRAPAATFIAAGVISLSAVRWGDSIPKK
jgi:hypothetical protein